MISDLKTASLKRWLLPQTSQQLAAQYFLFSGVAIVIAVLLAIVLRLELQQPGIQLFRSAELYRLVSEGHSVIALIYAIIPFLFAGFGYAFLPEMRGLNKLPFRYLGAIAFWLLVCSLLIFIVLYTYLMHDYGFGVLYAPLTTQQASAWIDYIVYTTFFLSASSIILTATHFLTCFIKCKNKAEVPLSVWYILISAVYVIFSMLVLIVEQSVLLFTMQNMTIYGNPRLISHISSNISYKFIITLCLQSIMCQIISLATSKEIAFSPVNKILAGLFCMLVILETMLLDNIMFSWVSESSLPYKVTSAVPLILMFLNISWVVTAIISKKRNYIPLLWAFIFLLIPYSSLIILRYSGALQPDITLRDTHAYSALMHMIFYASAMCAIFAAWYTYYPKIVGKQYVPALAIAHFIIFVEGVYLTFVPQMLAGALGMPRLHFDYLDILTPFNNLSSIGSYILAGSFILFAVVWKFSKPVMQGDTTPEPPFIPRAL